MLTENFIFIKNKKIKMCRKFEHYSTDMLQLRLSFSITTTVSSARCKQIRFMRFLLFYLLSAVSLITGLLIL